MLRAALVAIVVAGCAATDESNDERTGSTRWAVTNAEVDDSHGSTVRVDVNGEATCSATFVSPRVAVTAAHCLFDAPAHIRLIGDDGWEASAGLAAIMPGFDPATLERDLAVLVTTTPQGRVARLRGAPRPGAHVVVVGYGRGEEGASSVVERRRGTSIVEDVTQTGFSTLPGPALACAGDSGGAAYARADDGEEALVGVVSHGDARCARRAHFTRLDEDAAALIAAVVERDANGANPPLPTEASGCSTAHAPRRPTLGSACAVVALLLRRAVRRRPRLRLAETVRGHAPSGS